MKKPFLFLLFIAVLFSSISCAGKQVVDPERKLVRQQPTPTPGDTMAPVITIIGGNPVNVLAGSTYMDLGATATDNVDGNITANVITTTNVNTSVVGAYSVIYTVSDIAGNVNTATRTVNVVSM